VGDVESVRPQGEELEVRGTSETRRQSHGVLEAPEPAEYAGVEAALSLNGYAGVEVALSLTSRELVAS
jgi:hypothetical protein